MPCVHTTKLHVATILFEITLSALCKFQITLT